MTRAHAQDQRWMRATLSLARRGLGQVAPNPSVACILIKDDAVIGRGWTQPGGRPHAETVALAQAGTGASGATAYVSLEPCAHTGQTGPCAQALIDAGVARVVVALHDPDPRVKGKGIAMMEKAGVEVVRGVCSSDAVAINDGFFSRTTRNRPSFTLKCATTLDGKIALASGQSKWITGPEARKSGHRLRAKYDAILVGVGTVLADDPSLTCRLDGVKNQNPVRIVLDSALKTPVTANVVKDEAPTLIFTHSASDEGASYPPSVEVVVVDSTRDVAGLAEQLARRGLNSILIEGGAQVAASFVAAGMVDRIEHFVAGKVIGQDGLDALGPLSLASLGESPHFMLQRMKPVGSDMLASYVKAE